MLKHFAVASLLTISTLTAIQSARAFGGDDTQPGTKINAVTRVCMKTIAAQAAVYGKARTDAINACLDAAVACDESSTSANASACRGKLLIPGKGACAEGKLDSGINTIGIGVPTAAAAVMADPLSKAKINRALIKFIKAVDKKCFQVAGVDLGNFLTTGLGYDQIGGPPTDAIALTDLINDFYKVPEMSCRVDSAIANLQLLNSQISQLLLGRANTCVVVDAGFVLGGSCSQNTDCGPTAGACGKIAMVLKENGGSGLASFCPF